MDWTNLLAHSFLIAWQLELHAPKLMLNLPCSFPYLVPALSAADSLLRLIVELHECFHHVLSLPQRAKLIVVAVSILLEEIILQHCGHIQRDLVWVAQGRLADQLNDLIKIF